MSTRIVSRRTFLRSGAWAMAGALIVPVVPKIFLPPRAPFPWDALAATTVDQWRKIARAWGIRTISVPASLELYETSAAYREAVNTAAQNCSEAGLLVLVDLHLQGEAFAVRSGT